MNRPTLIDNLARFFVDQGRDVVAAYLFGSYARGEARSGSDLDIAVLLRQTPASSLMNPTVKLRGELERQFHIPVDLIVMNSAPVDLIHRILRDGVLLTSQDSPKRIAFEVKARNDYFDLLPHLHSYRGESAA